MRKMIVIFNHEVLSEEQIKYSKSKLDVSDIKYLDEDLKQIWRQIDPFLDKLDLSLIEDFVLKNSEKKDFVLIQGEFGATYKLVNFCFKYGRIPLYATTERKSVEEKNEDGSVEKRSLFRFVRFREYEKYL